MVHRPSDLRLLNSLLSTEKEYHKHLLVLLDTQSQQSLGAFAAYASASPAPVARALIAVAGSFAGADDALRRYAVSIETWHAGLRALKDVEEEVKNIMRDREILVTRLIKLSKNQKPTRDSFIGNLGSATGDASQISLSSFTPAVASSSKLGSAQSELQACESHLAAKEKELDQLRISTVQRGLEARCKAMVECGWNWGEMGKEGLRALEGMEKSAHVNEVSSHHHKLLPDSDRPTGSDLSSIGPSQSASQIYLPAFSSAVFTDQSASTPPRAASPSPFPPRSSSPYTGMPLSSITLQIPPAHSISEFALPSTIERRITEEQDGDNSSEEDSRPVEVVENVRFKSGVGASASTSNASPARRFSMRGPRPRDNSGSNTTSSGTGTGTGSFTQHTSSTLPPSQSSTHISLSHVPLPAPLRERKGSGGFFSSIAGLFRGSGNTSSPGAEKWRTRTEANLRAARRGADSDSEDEGITESPSRRLFGRRVSHDISAPPSPSPAPAPSQKLRKRNTRVKDRDEGWISDGATVAGRGARKGSMKQRPPLSGAPPSTSAHKRSASLASGTPSFVSASGSSTPTRTKPKAKPKTDLRVETLSRSSSTNAPRQGILRSSESVPPVPKISGPGERSSEMPSSQSTSRSSLSRNSSLTSQGKSTSTLHVSRLPPPSHADTGRAGNSLLAIVENVTRDNRAAWDRSTSGLPSDPGNGAGPVGGLVSVRAPPSVTKYNLRGEGGHGISFESVLAPGSVLAAQPPASSSRSRSQRPTSLPPPPRAPMTAPAGTPPKIPLRSALRAQSPPPTPPVKPIVIPSAPPRVVVERVVVEAPAAPPAINGRENKDDDDDGSDSGSIASFRTVRENLDDSPTPTPPSAPAPAAVAESLAPPAKDDSDVSASTASLGTGTTRRKSVRMSLQPTFSPTPPALDEDENEAWGRSGRPWGVVANGGPNGSAGGKERERDYWADSSDEDEEYANARKLLMRTGKKRW
ncbi:hypothetical protein V8E53_008665 [Lactarius tabidus]